MSREFDGGSQYIEVASAVLSGVPITMACWFNSDSIAAIQTLMMISDHDATTIYFSLELDGVEAGDPIRCLTRNVAALGFVRSTTGYSADTWHHACAVFTAVDNRDIYLDGGSNASNATSVTPVNLSHTILGVSHTNSAFNQHMNGEIAEAAIWNTALTVEEVAILAAGYSPLLVRPESLVLYMPLVRELHDIVGRIGMANTGTTVGDHPAILTPASPQLVPAAASAVADTFLDVPSIVLATDVQRLPDKSIGY